MKKFIALLLALAMACPLAACSQSNGGEEVIDITLPALFYSAQTEEDIAAQAEEYNCISYSINEDSSVTYTLTQSSYEEILEGIEAGNQVVIDDMLSGEYGTSAFKEIVFNDTYTQFDIYLDSAEYTDYMIMYAYSFFISGAYYQLFAGIPEDDIDVLVTLLDYETEEYIISGTYRQAAGLA